MNSMLPWIIGAGGGKLNWRCANIKIWLCAHTIEGSMVLASHNNCAMLKIFFLFFSREVDAIMGISPDSLVLIQDNLNHDILFLTSTRAVIGWTALQNSIRIYFHQVRLIFLTRNLKRLWDYNFTLFQHKKILYSKSDRLVCHSLLRLHTKKLVRSN